MKCDICGNREAVIFVHQTTGESKTELRLCAECAKERGVDRLDGDVSSSVSKLLAAVAAARTAGGGKKPAQKRCPRCGSALADVRRRGLAGCASCWIAIGDSLRAASSGEPTFRLHAGRLPSRLEALRAAAEDAARLRAALEEAIRDEDYETAARCRDRIRELEEGERGRAR